MSLTAQQKNQLKKIIEMASQLLNEDERKPNSASRNVKGQPATRVRRSGAKLTRFRKQLKSDRKAGVPVTELAKKYGVTPSYIYQL